MKFARVKANCAGPGSFITKIKSFLCPPLRIRILSPDFGLRAWGSLDPSPVAAPGGSESAVQRGGHLVHLPELPVLPRRQRAARAWRLGRRSSKSCRGKLSEPKLLVPSTASNGTRSRSLDPRPGAREECLLRPAFGHPAPLLEHKGRKARARPLWQLPSTLYGTPVGSSPELRLALCRRPFPSTRLLQLRTSFPSVSGGSQGPKPTALW